MFVCLPFCLSFFVSVEMSSSVERERVQLLDSLRAYKSSQVTVMWHTLMYVCRYIYMYVLPRIKYCLLVLRPYLRSTRLQEGWQGMSWGQRGGCVKCHVVWWIWLVIHAYATMWSCECDWLFCCHREAHASIVTAVREKGAGSSTYGGRREEEKVKEEEDLSQLPGLSRDEVASQEPFVHYTPADLHYEKGWEYGCYLYMSLFLILLHHFHFFLFLLCLFIILLFLINASKCAYLHSCYSTCQRKVATRLQGFASSSWSKVFTDTWTQSSQG